MPPVSPLRFYTASPASFALDSPWGHAAPPVSGLQASVIVPAKDEAATIEATLTALAAQTDRQGNPLPPRSFEVLLLANNCEDDTAAVAREWARKHPALALHVAEIHLPSADAHIGQVRRQLMDEACSRLELAGCEQGFIASTDADTQASPTWLAATAAALAAGADAVGGRILTTEAQPSGPVRRCQLQDATYQLLRAQLEQLLDPLPHDPWPRHHQHFGASFAITAAAYRRVGGLPVVPYLEDEALYQALIRQDLRVRHSPTVQVFTSGRQQGRVAVGLSWQLREWASLGGVEPLVAHPAEIAAEVSIRRQARLLWQSRNGQPVTTHPLLESLVPLLTCYTTFGELWQEYQPQLRASLEQQPLLPLSEAIRVLRQLVVQATPRLSPVNAA
ncbi:glycosyltransferase family 2 protein [Hymenobacter sp. UYP22]|uniref:glycosyltransferase n=1 Tax=Hymenobacter sp. UYP22 TaxID=3156348 RepID=UPI003395C357